MSLDYGAGVGSERLRNAIATTVGCGASEVVVTHGAVEALLLACSAVVGDRRDFAVASPAYEGLLRAVEAAGGIAHRVRVWKAGSAHLDVSALADLELGRYAAIVLNSPHNPTGLQVERSDLEALAEHCAHSGTALIVDQVSLGTLDPETADWTALGIQGCRVLVVGDVSKAYGLGGLRVGWCASKEATWLSRIADLRHLTTISSSRPAQLLAAIALENRDRLSISNLARSNLRRLDRCMTSVSGATLVRPADGLVAFCGLPLRRPSISFAEMLRTRSEVSVTPGAFFGHDDHLRIGLGVDEDAFAAGLRRLADALEDELPESGSRESQLPAAEATGGVGN